MWKDFTTKKKPKSKAESKKKKNLENVNETEQMELAQKQKDLIKYLSQNVDEDLIINKARYNWKILRTRKMIVNMIPYIGETYVKELYDKRNFNQNKI